MNPSAQTWTVDSFAKSVLDKYPNGVTNDGIPYNKLSPQELTRRVVDKYPVYASQIKELVQNKTEKSIPFATLAGEKTTNAYMGAADKMQEAGQIANSAHSSNLFENAWKGLESGIRFGGGIAEAAQAPVSGFVGALLSKLKPTDSSGNAIKSITAPPEGFKGLDIAPKIEEWAQKHPEAVKNLSDLFAIASLPATVEGLSKVPAMQENVGTSLKNAGSGLKESVVDTLDTASNISSKVKNTLTNAYKGRSQEDILSTPESDVHKLAWHERQFYFENAKNQVAERANAIEAQIKKELQTQVTAAQTEAENLTKELSTASRDKVIELRPKIIKALGKQSDTYRKLVDEEISQYADVPVMKSEVARFVDSRYADNPELATAIKNKLNVETPEIKTPTIAPGEATPTANGIPEDASLPTIQANKPDATIGDIFDKTKALKQEIGSAAKKGTRVYTADEKLTDDAISTLSSFMKSKGVDLKEANSFWAKYAPVRNQLVSEAKPFVQSGTQTKTFANTLARVAKGTDINNENFIKEVENILGEPITKDLKTIVQKLDTTTKAEIASKIQAETKLIENNLLKEQALKKLGEKAFEIERNARLRDAIWKILLVGAGVKAATWLTGSDITHAFTGQ